MNQFQAIGRLVRDPETRAIGGDQTASNMSLAINKKWKDKAGEWKEDVLYIKASAFGFLSQKAAGMKKGDLVFIMGALEQRKWADKEGNQRETIEVKLTTLESINTAKVAGKSDDWKNKGKPAPVQEKFSSDMDDEIPF